jgi:hypothetical protein
MAKNDVTIMAVKITIVVLCNAFNKRINKSEEKPIKSRLLKEKVKKEGIKRKNVNSILFG